MIKTRRTTTGSTTGQSRPRPGTGRHRKPDGLHDGSAGAAPALPKRRLLAPAVDVLALVIATLLLELASPTSSPTGEVPREPLVWVLAFSVLVLWLFGMRGMYTPPMRLELLEELRLVFTGTAVAATVVLTARVLVENEAYVAAQTVRHFALALPLLMAGRAALLLAEVRARRQGRAGWPTLIIGAGRVGQLTVERLLREPELGLRPIGFLDDDPLDLGEERTLPVFGTDHDLEAVVSEHQVRHAIITFSNASHEDLLSTIRRCWQLGVSVSVVPRLFEIEGRRITTERLGGLPLVGVRPVNPRGWQFAVKYAFDRLGAALAVLLTLPLLAAVALAVRVSMGSPIFYRQRRVGLDGREFEMLKFRTMRPAATGEGEADASWAAEQLTGAGVPALVTAADRLTPLGAFLRRFSLDELPQLWNVLRGDMSLIGPRPERVSYVQRFEESIYRYGDRHRVKSGLTGWAQVNGLRGKSSLSDRIEWDNYYIENWSLWLDFKILLRTLRCLVRGQESVPRTSWPSG